MEDISSKPLQLLTSRLARVTLLHSFLIITASSIVLGISIFAYGIFYYNFVPQIEIEKVVNLQYGVGPHPYGIISLGSELISRQAYDIFLFLNLPRSPQNLARGNFMTSLALLHPKNKFTLSHTQKLGISELKSPLESLGAEDILHIFRRTAIITYASHLVSLTSRLLTLPLYTLGLLSEKETLTIKVGEGVSFLRGWKNIPSLALLEIQAGPDIQIYDVVIIFKAQFSGLRWLMYNHRITSFILFAGLFWMLTMVFAALAWIGLSMYTVSKKESTERNETHNSDNGFTKIEETMLDEGPDLSDTPRTFPSHGRQPALIFVPKIKDERDSMEILRDESYLKVEADQEDDGAYIGENMGFMTDSGIGTSLSESGEKMAARRRLSGRKNELF